MNRFKMSLLKLICVMLIFTSCAKEGGPLEEFSSPEKTYRIWLETAEKEDLTNNVRCLTEESKKLIDDQMKSLDSFMKKLKIQMRIFKEYKIVDQRINGNEAIVVIKGPGEGIFVVPFKKEIEGWKVDLVAFFGGMAQAE